VTRTELHDFARAGAQARLQAILEERAAIIRMFPDLRTRRTADSLDGPGPLATRARRRRRMSAAERKAVGRRMRANWAKRRAEKTGAKKARLKPARKSGMSAEARKAQAERMKAYWAVRRGNAGSTTAEPADSGAANAPLHKAGHKAVRGRKARQRQEPNK
jgi:hypothetical protein